MKPRTIDNYGGPYNDMFPVADPEAQLAAALFNRLALDVAQLTRTPWRAVVVFTTSSGANGNYLASAVQHRSIWGSGSAQKPTVAKTGTGLYSIAYAATFADELGDSNEDENVSFFGGTCEAMSPTAADNVSARLLTCAGNVATLVTKKGTTISDTGDSSNAVFPVIVYLL